MKTSRKRNVLMFEERIKRGIALLNKKYRDVVDDETPWMWYIKPDQLDLSDKCNCVLGQVFGDYADGLYELGLQQDEAYFYGFSIPAYELTEIGITSGFAQLTEEWKEALQELHERIEQTSESCPSQ
jgi:hypothetical protein